MPGEPLPLYPGNWAHLNEYLSDHESRLAGVSANSSGEHRVGNYTNWDPGPQTGNPAGNSFAVKFLHTIGTPGTTVKQTNQAFVGWTTYKERTVDDSAEAASYGVILTDAYGGFASPQTLPVVGFESDVLVQGAVSVTNKAIAVVGGAKVQSTAHADSTMQFYAAQTTVDAGATVTNRYGFYDEGLAPGSAATNKWSFYGKLDVQTESRLIVGISGAQTDSQRVLIVGEGAAAATNPSLDVRMATSQTAASVVVSDSGGVKRGQWFGSTGNLLIGSAATGGSGNGILSFVTTTIPSGTPPAAGAYLFVDPADNKLKAKTSGGTTTILTAVA